MTSACSARKTCGPVHQKWVALAVISLPCMLYSMDLTVLNLAVPQLSADLRPSSSELLWIIDIYGFMLAGFLIPMGALGDRIGRRRLLLFGAAAFGIASICAAFSRTVSLLIASRAVLGLAAATLAPSTLALIRNLFLEPRQRSIAIGVWTASFSVGGAAGPLLGGLLLERWRWGSVFLLAVPVMGLLLVLGPRLLPEFRDDRRIRLDVLSALAWLSAALSTVYLIKSFAQDGYSWRIPVCLLTASVMGAAFIRQQRLSDPVIDLQLFRSPAFTAAVLTNGLAIFVAFAASFLMAQYLQLVLGLAPVQAGLWMVPKSMGLIIGCMLAPSLLRRVSAATMIAVGLLLAAGGFVLLSHAQPIFGPGPIATGLFLVALGIAPAVTLTTDLVVSMARPEQAGVASGISETSSELGGALGIAVLGSVATIRYRIAIDLAVPADTAQTLPASARDTLIGTLDAASALPDVARTELVTIAQDAFVNALQVTSSVSAATLVVSAIGVALVLRKAVLAANPIRPADPARTG